MSKVTFFPLGNADTTLIELDNNKKILVDFAHCVAGEDEDDKKCDLDSQLRSRLDKNNLSFDVVAFTHADEDHTRGAADFFELEYAQKYQGGNRVKIKELWVPAAMILEEGLSGDDQNLRQEARFRLRNGRGVRVFSSPHLLDQWFAQENITPESRSHLITDAGTVVPGLNKAADGIEFFAHSPFAHRDGEELQSRNDGSLFMHATLVHDGVETGLILGGDTTHEVLEEIIQITKYKGNESRLKWDLYKLSHHCSAHSLGKDRPDGDAEMIPSETVDWLFGHCNTGAYIISPSNPIPTDDENHLPPHRQAAKYYKRKAGEKGGQFKVTMEHPNGMYPEPMEFEINKFGLTLKKRMAGGASVIVNNPSPKVG